MKRIRVIFIIILLVVIALGIIGIRYAKEQKEKKEEVNENLLLETPLEGEYVPEQEISESQNRQTIVNTYFLDKETKKLKTESRLVDIKEMYLNPYEKLMQLLIDGPNNNELEALIPTGTKLNSAIIEENCVVIDFSKEILNNSENMELMINSIVNTLSELTEVNKVRFIVDGKTNEKFNNDYSKIK